MFFKPSLTVTGHNANVVIPRIAQDSQADYEGELVCLQSVLNQNSAYMESFQKHCMLRKRYPAVRYHRKGREGC
jgi:hypothetical protein